MIPFGRALDARKERPVVPANALYSAPPLTVECFAKLDSAKGFNILVANEPKSSATHWELYTYAGTGFLSVYMPGYAPAEVRSDACVTDGKWHYCAFSFDGRVVRLFVDGRQVKAERVLRQTGIAPVSGPLCVGDVPGAGIGCDGLIDEVRVSGVVRSIAGVPAGPFEDDSDTLALWHFDPAFAAVGHSELKDPFRAGAEAALRSRKALGSASASAVVVFDNLGTTIEEKRQLLDGIGWFFDAASIYGCSGFGAIGPAAGPATVAVLALGDAIAVSSAVAPVASDHEACGRAIGGALRPALDKAGKGRVVLLIGDCHVPADDALTRGAAAALGDATPIVGGSCPQDGYVYHRGVVQQHANVGLLVSGEFTVGFALRAAGSPGEIAASAASAASQAIAGGSPGLLLVFNCVSRLQALGADAPKEIEALRGAAGTAPLFGFYGSGEIGRSELGGPSRGVGGHVSVCALLRTPGPTP